jgi:hypothetical protein
MKLNPIQQALLRITSTGQLTQKHLETISSVFLQVAAKLESTARAQTDQSEADAMHAGSCALASISRELRAGGQTDESIDYLSRAFTASASCVMRDADLDDDDERMEAREEESRK